MVTIGCSTMIHHNFLKENAMSPSITEKNGLLSMQDNHDRAVHLHRKGQKIRFEDEEAEIIRISPLMVIKTRYRIVCGALHHRIEYLAA